jgi:hypothetical protein
VSVLHPHLPTRSRRRCGRSAARRLHANLLLVPVGPRYRPALPISKRPELAAAFAQGQAARATGRAHDDGEVEQVMAMSADEQTAYWLGLSDVGLRAPASLLVTVPFVLGDAVAQMLGTRPRWWKVALFLPCVMAIAYAQNVSERSRVRALGVTTESAPRPAPSSIVTARLLLVGIQRVWVGHRDGHWGAVSPGSVVAASALREWHARRDWRAVYQRGPSCPRSAFDDVDEE